MLHGHVGLKMSNWLISSRRSAVDLASRYDICMQVMYDIVVMYIHECSQWLAYYQRQPQGHVREMSIQISGGDYCKRHLRKNNNQLEVSRIILQHVKNCGCQNNLLADTASRSCLKCDVIRLRLDQKYSSIINIVVS